MLLAQEKHFLLFKDGVENKAVPEVQLVNCSSDYEVNAEILELYEQGLVDNTDQVITIKVS